MRHDVIRKATNVSLDVDLVRQARELGVNISRACENGLEKQVAKDRAERWREENREAIECWNDYVEEHGLPLARHRTF
ncbi:type II toxin-antitoxin system CcdA family antitoxin [Sphingomonas gilva]|nr:type II toxin-antitoxin system CcdA family antitoxin [Sphingomonas gilva]